MDGMLTDVVLSFLILRNRRPAWYKLGPRVGGVALFESISRHGAQRQPRRLQGAIRYAACAATVVVVASLGNPCQAAGAVLCPPGTDFQPVARQMADFVLSLQGVGGGIEDAPGSMTANEDSNMEYALIGLAAAYQATADARYLSGLDQGIRWLAARQEMVDPEWRGSWYYVFSTTPPYDPIPTSVGRGIHDVRGVDATSALFVYLLFLHQQLSGTNTLVDTHEANARAALDFVLNKNRAADGFFLSSWQQDEATGAWELYRFEYAADQGDVYLGLRAGALLYGDATYAQAADFLHQEVPEAFFNVRRKRYAVGREEYGRLYNRLERFDGIFPQGYLPWIFGGGTENQAALVWLRSRVRRDGGLGLYSLGAAMVGLATAGLGESPPLQSFCWLATVPFDPGDGGVRDTRSRFSAKYVNVAAFSAMSLLRFVPLP